MTSCACNEEALWLAAETGDIPPKLARHLPQCAHCRATLQALGGAMDGFTELRGVTAPDPCAAVRARLARPAWPLRLLPALAAALALCGLLLLFWTIGKRPHGPATAHHQPPVAPRMAYVPSRMPITIPGGRQQTITRLTPKTRRYRHPPLHQLRMAEIKPTRKSLTTAELLAQPCRQYTAIDPDNRPPSSAPGSCDTSTMYCALFLPEPVAR